MMMPCRARQCGMVAGTGREGKGDARGGRVGRVGWVEPRRRTVRDGRTGPAGRGGVLAFGQQKRRPGRLNKKTAFAVWAPFAARALGCARVLGGPGGTALGEGLGAGFPPDARRDTLEKGYTPGTMGRLLEISRGLEVSGCKRLLTRGIVDESEDSNASAVRWALQAEGNPALAGQVGVCYRHRPRMPGSVKRPKDPRSRTDAARWWPPGRNFTNIPGARPRRVAIRG